MSTELATVQQQSTGIDLFNPAQFEHIQRVAKFYSSSDLVPKDYQLEKNPKAVANCMIAFDIANRMGANILMVMQNMVPIQGKPSFSAQFIIAMINASGKFDEMDFLIVDKGPVRDELEYPDQEWDKAMNKGQGGYRQIKKKFTEKIRNISCVAVSRRKGETKDLVGPEVTVEMAILEGWYTKKGSKWPTMLEVMLRYRAATFWKSIYAAQLLMGIPSTEEIKDINSVEDTEYTDLGSKIKGEAKKKAEMKIEVTQETEKEPEPEKQPEPEKKPEPELNVNMVTGEIDPIDDEDHDLPTLERD